jgi:hypothetical protein
MRLNMSSKPQSQFPRRIEHQLTVTPHNRSIDDHSRRLNIFKLSAEEVMFKSRVRGRGDERGCVKLGCWV